MSKQRKKKDKQRSARPAPAAPATPRPQPRPIAQPAAPAGPTRPLTFGAETYKWMGVGFGLVLLGLLLMSGGRGDDPNVFDESVIYSFRKITLAPAVILAGLGTVIYAILKK